MPEMGVSTSGWDILYQSDRSGHFGWCNQPANGEVDALQAFFRLARPDVVMELGTRFAGMALAIHDAVPDAKLFSIDELNSPETEDIISGPAAEGEYSDPSRFPCRSWFPPRVRFLRMNFLTQSDEIKKIVGAVRKPYDRLVCFVDGYDKDAETRAYASWLRPNDIMAVNNWHDQCGGAEALDRLLGTDYRRFMWSWSEGRLALTRMWRKL